MNVLVTGAAGFIGSKTVEFLLNDGHRVIGVDNLNDYYDVRLKYYRLSEIFRILEEPGIHSKWLSAASSGVTPADSLIDTPNFRFGNIDIESAESLESFTSSENIDVVINLAARAGVRYSMEHPHVYLSTNAEGTLNLLELMRKRGIMKLVLASTSSLYAGQPMPFVESLPVNEPISPYAASKKAAEALAFSYHHLYGIDVSVVRYFTVFGPAGRPDMAPYRFVKWIYEGTPITLYGDGEQSRDFTFIDDIASGTLAAMKDVNYSVFNLGGGNNPVSINTTISWIEDAFSRKAQLDRKPFHKADMEVTFANIEKAKNDLGWEPTVGVKEGFDKTIAWYLENQKWLSEIPV